jgi:hypothetical protein
VSQLERMDRQAVLDALRERVTAAGGTLLRTVKDLAADIGIPSQRLYYLLGIFEQNGAITTRSRGPKGLEIRLGGDGPLPPAGAGRRGRARAAGGASRPGGTFCPWCGHPTEAGWRFCVSCGERLPEA